MAESKSNRNSRGGPVFSLLLLISIIAHGVLFSARTVKPSLENSFTYTSGREGTDDRVPNNIDGGTNGYDGNDDEQEEEYLPQLGQSGDQTEEEAQAEEQLPHWRLATDCSSYSLDCFTQAQREHKYLPYPFSPSLRKEIEVRSPDNNTVAFQQQKEWSVETFDHISKRWIRKVKGKNNRVPVEERNYIYPPKVPQEDIDACLDLAIRQNKTTLEQLDVLFSKDSPIVVPEPDTNMVAFTISDYSYVRDMLHEIFQMMDETVGFSSENFFLVAIDQKSVELACQHGYPVVMWKADEGNLKDAVANTKIIVSRELVKRGIDFFFTEMDVWWIRSPKQNLVDFQKWHDDEEHDEKHLYFSGHQNNPFAPNIGVYAVKANKYTEEYFNIVIDVLKQKPETHDQLVMAEVYRLFSHVYNKRDYKLGGKFQPGGPPETPKVKNPFKAKYFSPHEVVADERPMPTHETLAVHTLNGTPLQMPHGKKMIAKELGVYHGFRSNPSSQEIGPNAAGYYERSGQYRKYIMLDTSTRTNMYSDVQRGRYHNRMTTQWTMALLIALARKTDRILVLPQVFEADMDAGTYFSWPMMDYSKVSEMVDFRETNFVSNRRSWKHDGDGWPFESVVSTALFDAKDPEEKISIYTQVTHRSEILSKKAWRGTIHDNDILDSWVGSLLTMTELESAELLLVNPDRNMRIGKLGGMISRLQHHEQYYATDEDKRKGSPPPVGRMELELKEIYDMLGWCWDVAYRHSVSKTSASDSCYGIGGPPHK